MRMRATAAVAAVSGALALTGAAIPSAQAAGQASALRGWTLAQHLQATHAAGGTFVRTEAGTGQPYPLGVTFSGLRVDYGRAAVAVGTTQVVHVPYSFTLTATDTDVSASDFYAGADLYRGSAADPINDLYGDAPATCSVTTSTSGPDGVTTVETCKGTVDIDPGQELSNDDAGAHWHAVAWAVALNGQSQSNPDLSKVGVAQRTGLAAPALQRYSRLTVNAAPEPIAKGRTLTVVGSLTRANWNSLRYAGYSGQPVRLQFRKRNSSVYTTLRTVTTDSHGNLKATWKATADGYWRYSFAGTSTTPAVSARGDYVDVR